MDLILNKSRTRNTKKLYFELPHGDKIFKIRACCLVLRDLYGNCLMTIEPGLSNLEKSVLGFCGGTIEEYDGSIVDTIMRESYEECVLADVLPEIWEDAWPVIYDRIKNNPNTYEEVIFNYIYNIVKYRETIFLDGHNIDLRCIYFQVILPRVYSDYLVSIYHLQVVSSDMFKQMINMRDSQIIKDCIKRKILSYRVDGIYFRMREILISSLEFTKFLQHGLNKIDFNPPYNSVVDVARYSNWYHACNQGKRHLKLLEVTGDPICIDVCCMRSFLMSRYDWQNIYDIWYKAGSVDHGVKVLNLLNHFLYGTRLFSDLQKTKELYETTIA